MFNCGLRIADCGLRAGIAAALILLNCAGAHASDNELTAKEKRAGWQLLFDGKTLNGWMTSTQTPSKVPVDDGCIQPHGCGGYLMIHEKEGGDFIFSLGLKKSKDCNSGGFFLTFPLTPRPGQGGGVNRRGGRIL